MPKRIVSAALYEEVAARLREAIYTHQSKPGQWVDEQRLAEVYGISRSPLREFLKLLNAEGLVTLKRRRGRFVRELTGQDHLMKQPAALAAHDAMRQAAYPADASPTDDGGVESPKPARRKAGRSIVASVVEG